MNNKKENTKSGYIDFFYITLCVSNDNLKGGTCSDEPRENYHLILQLPSA